MGIKYIQDGGHNMKFGDYVSIVIDGPILDDRYGKQDGKPELDTFYEDGSDDVCESLKVDRSDGFVSYKWARYLNTGDPRDTVLEINDCYHLLWAYGETADGII